MTRPKNTTTKKRSLNDETLIHLAEKVQRKNLKIIKQQNRDYLKQRVSISRKKKRKSTGDGTESESDRIARECFEEWLKEQSQETSKNDGDEENKKADEDETAKKCHKKQPLENIKENQDLSGDSEDEEAKQSYKKWRQDDYDSYNTINRKILLSKIDMFEKMLEPKKVAVECASKSMALENKVMWTSPTYIARYIRKCILKHKWSELAHLLLLLLKHSHLYESFTKEITFLVALMSVDKCKKDLLSELDLCFVTEKTQETKEFDVWYTKKLMDGDDMDV